MATYTDHLQLIKLSLKDPMDVELLNQNMDKLDAAFHAIDPDVEIPDVAEVLEHMDAVEQATDAANTAAASISKRSALASGYTTLIPENTDYDDLTTTGNYRCSTAGSAGTMIHAPSTTAAHRLTVLSTTDSSKLLQLAVVNWSQGALIRYRSSTDRGVTWKPADGWFTLATRTDLENAEAGLEASVEAVAEEVTALHARVSESDLPAYYFENSYLPGKIDLILANRRTLAAAGCQRLVESVFFTDPHFFRDTPASSDNGLQSVKLIRYILDKTNIGFVVCGGDLTSGSAMTNLQCRTLFSAVRELMAPIWDKAFLCVGNHEWNNPSNDPDQTAEETDFLQVYPHLIGDKARFIGGYESSAGSYWTDDPMNRVRTFFLGCNSVGNLVYAQFQWLFSALKETPAGYTIVVYSHVALGTDGGSVVYLGNFERVAALLDAVKNGESYSYQWPSTSAPLTYDFSGSQLDVACVLSGHKHRDLDKVTSGGIPIISTMCDRGPTGSSSEAYIAAKTIGTVREQTIDVVQIDLTNKTVDLTRIGGSYDGTGPLSSPNRHYAY